MKELKQAQLGIKLMREGAREAINLVDVKLFDMLATELYAMCILHRENPENLDKITNKDAQKLYKKIEKYCSRQTAKTERDDEITFTPLDFAALAREKLFTDNLKFVQSIVSKKYGGTTQSLYNKLSETAEITLAKTCKGLDYKKLKGDNITNLISKAITKGLEEYIKVGYTQDALAAIERKI